MTKAWTNPGSPPWVPDLVVTDTHLDTHVSDLLDFLGGSDGHSGSVGVGPIVYGTQGAASMGASSYATLQSGTIASKGGSIIAHFAGRFTHDTTNSIVTVGLNIDGGSDIDIAQYQSADYINERFSLGAFAAFAGAGTTGNRVVNARWKVDTGNVSAIGTELYIEEIRP